ncbi:hypothetical protein MNEG_15033 [Monoraphidium neglectum]|uniref:Uncharacterized protein n=1 Tax=Monoraphidium neglectum TaxID=145388 RepID=A0A0D2MCD2_9CHLO|nr:hypothetical protein MNEG_15033 [Monoraphidium neglectum]KIY92930.1 hypothetical protein MNEG_15033 [Monoraphidium neglectum]|eukprot:XP_013891950.1 hypothetical protein MNEG_15033 [Monoraphidium neglectum]
MPKQKLLLDDEEEPQDFTIKVNEDFAKRFEHNKRREELHRLQEKHPHMAAKLADKFAKQAGKQQPGGQKQQQQQNGGGGGGGNDGSDEDDSASEDDDEEEPPDDTEKASTRGGRPLQARRPSGRCDGVLSTLIKIRRHDPEVFKPEVHFFADDEDGADEDGDGGDGEGRGGKEKPMYLRSVLAQQVWAGV